MTLTAGDLDKLKEINPGTLRIVARTDESDPNKEHLWLVCTRVRDSRTERPQYITELEDGNDFFEDIIAFVISHQRSAHEPIGHVHA